jgi:hypothetical protein
VLLDGNSVNRRGAGEEGKGREGSRWNDGKKCLHRGDDGGHVQRDRRLYYLGRNVGRGAERAVCMGEIPIRMNVDRLDGSAGNDQRNTQESEEKLPRTLAFRI